jgi:hypothetical protein
MDSARFQLQVAERSEKHGSRSRKGRIVPHTKNAFNDMYDFQARRIIERKMSGMLFEDSYDYYSFCRDQEADIYMGGYQYPRNYFEEQTLRRDFIESLS